MVVRDCATYTKPSGISFYMTRTCVWCILACNRFIRAGIISCLTSGCVAVSFVCILTRINTFSTMELYTMGASASCLCVFLCTSTLPNAWFPCKQKKHNLFYSENFALCVGVFSLNIERFHKACLPLQRIQDGHSNFFSIFLVEAKTLVIALVLVRSSTLGFPDIFFLLMRLCFIFKPIV